MRAKWKQLLISFGWQVLGFLFGVMVFVTGITAVAIVVEWFAL